MHKLVTTDNAFIDARLSYETKKSPFVFTRLMSYITCVNLLMTKTVETCRFIKHLLNFVVSTIFFYVTLKSDVHNRALNSSPLVSFLSQINPIQSFPSNLR